ncbi:MAG: transketolase [Parasporobacterium sp.]|nr:transketolase [Parasporobacterium sp.]
MTDSTRSFKTRYTKAETQKIANSIRRQILGIAIRSGGCYLSQACSSAEIIAALYTKIMNLGPSAGNWDAIPFPGVPGPDNMDYQHGSLYNGAPAPDKDRFFVSCCHYASVIYCALAATGRINPAALDKFNVDGWNMEMIGAEHSPGFENTAGSLGQTVSIAAGTAHARKIKGETGLVYCLLGDGELQEGQTWECIQTAGHYKLDNFVVVIDANGQQVEGAIKDQMTEEPLVDRFESFGAKCVTCNGHDIDDIVKACRTGHKNRPLVVICRTHGYTGVPLLKKKWPLLHFVRISAEERPEYEKVYEELGGKC